MINYVFFNTIWSSFIISITFFVIGFLIIRLNSRVGFSDSVKSLLVLTLSFFIVFCFGLRSEDVGTDTPTYYLMYDNYVSGTYDRIKDLGFYIFIQIISLFGKEYFLFFCALLYLLPIMYVFTRKDSKILCFLLLITSFFFLNLGINIMRQGIALSIALMGLIFLINNKKRFLGYMILLLASLFHFSVLILVVFHLLSQKMQLKHCLFIYFTAIIVSFFGGGILEYLSRESFLTELISPRVDMYINSMDITTYKVGFRLDFIIYNTFFLFLSLFTANKINSKTAKIKHYSLVKIFILLSSVFFLSFYIPFSDRVGVLSWFLIPLLMVPFFSSFTKKHLLISSFIFLSNCILHFYI